MYISLSNRTYFYPNVLIIGWWCSIPRRYSRGSLVSVPMVFKVLISLFEITHLGLHYHPPPPPPLLFRILFRLLHNVISEAPSSSLEFSTILFLPPQISHPGPHPHTLPENSLSPPHDVSPPNHIGFDITGPHQQK